jgi:hypothetical protein
VGREDDRRLIRAMIPATPFFHSDGGDGGLPGNRTVAGAAYEPDTPALGPRMNAPL